MYPMSLRMTNIKLSVLINRYNVTSTKEDGWYAKKLLLAREIHNTMADIEIQCIDDSAYYPLPEGE